MHFVNFVLFVGAIAVGGGRRAEGQDTTRTWQPVPVVSAGLHVTSELLGHSALILGVGLGGERRIGAHADVRAFVAGYRHILGTAGDDVLFRYPNFPHHELAGGVDALLMPVGRNMKVLLGSGITYVMGSSKPYRGSEVADTTIGPRFMLRGGLELALGRSSRAPRIHYVRNVYAKSFLSAKWLDTFGLLFPR